jgi:adenylate cyclase
MRSPLAFVRPGSAKSRRGLRGRTQVLVTLAVWLANLIGAIVVFSFASWVVPTPRVPDANEARLVNLVAVGVYLLVALPVGAVWGARRLRAIGAWIGEERAPAEREARQVLRAPLHIAFINAVLWLAGTLVFIGLNALRFEPLLGLSVGITVALGGITTSAFAYLASERLLRAASARMLAAHTPSRPLVPGVTARALLAWALGTGVPALGLLLVGLFAITWAPVSKRELAITALGLAGVALLVGLLITFLTARATADPVISVRDALRRVEEGKLDTQVTVYDGSELGLLQAGFNRMAEGLRDRERIREAFGTYVDHDVAERVLEEGTSLEGEEVEVTLVFLDVLDFTSYVERSDAREVVATLNRLFERAVSIVHDHGGHVDKFIGDGLLAVFGAPRREPRHADRALAAALAVAEAVRDEFVGEVEVGLGLSSGRVVAGNIGGAGRLEFSVIGDAVNVAARAEEATRETGDAILLTHATAQLLEEREVDLEEREAVELKGKDERVRLWAPAGRRIAAAGGGETPRDDAEASPEGGAREPGA